MEKSKKLLSLFLAILLVLCSLAGCTQTAQQAEQATQPEETAQTAQSDAAQPVSTDGQNLDYVKLTWYYWGDSYPEQDEVFAAFNTILKEKINTEINFVPIAPSDYDQKMQTKYAAGDAGDLNWTSGWCNNYNSNVAKGAFYAMDDLLEQYAPDTYNFFTADQWNAMRVQGSIYGVPNAQIFTKSTNLVVRKDMADKYNFDVSSVKSYKDLEPLLEQTSKNDGMVYKVYRSACGFTTDVYAEGFDNLQGFFGVRYNDPSLTALCLFDTDEFSDYCNMIKTWAEKGYIASDALVLQEQDADTKAGKIAVTTAGTYQPGNEASEALQFGDGVDVYLSQIGESVLTTGGFTSTITAIPSSSKNPERAMMVINLMNTDTELYNLISFGIEGKHFEKNADGTVTLINSDKYTANPWVMGNTFLGYTLEGKSLDFNAGIVKLNNTAKASTALGFVFDATPVKTQLAQVQTVIDEYYPGLNCGAVDNVGESLEAFRAKLKSAGSDEIVAEMQRQLTAWAASK